MHEESEALWAVRAGPEYHDFLNDTLRLLTIQLTVQMLLVMVAPDRYSLGSGEFWALLLFVAAGSSLYWLVFRRALVFTS
jgi:hypothetical protein